MIHVKVSVRSIINGKPSTCICKIGKYLKSIADTSMIACDKIKYAMDIMLTNVANTIPTKALGTASVNCHNKKV